MGCAGSAVAPAAGNEPVGALTVDDLRSMLRKRGKADREIEAIIKLVDTDNDGLVSTEELEHARTEGNFLMSSLLNPGSAHVAMGASSVLNGAGPVKTTKGRALLIIDPQIDFTTGSLAVPGALEDSSRTVALMEQNPDAFEKIYVTLDTHHEMHIAHAAYWVAADGKSKPESFTQITAAQVEAGTWRPRVAEEASWALQYCQRLEAKGRFTLTIWPTHCLLGSTGHAVHPPLAEALHNWAARKGSTISWVLKGQNNRTEMYSALKAEVELDDVRSPPPIARASATTAGRGHVRGRGRGRGRGHAKLPRRVSLGRQGRGWRGRGERSQERGEAAGLPLSLPVCRCVRRSMPPAGPSYQPQ